MFRIAVVLAFLACALLPPGARAQEPITLKVVSSEAVTHWAAINGIQWWRDQVVAQSHGRIKIDFYPVGQLGKAEDNLDLVRNSVVDIAEFSTAFVAAEVPLSGVDEMPGLFDTACQGSAAYARLVKPGGLLAKLEYAPLHVRVLLGWTFPPYKVFTVDKPIRTLKDFAGLKLRTNGGGVEMTANRLGAVSVRMTSMDLYQSLSRHTLDGVFFALLSARPYDVQTLTKNVTLGVSFGSAGIVWAINERKWNALPADIQALLQRLADEAQQKSCVYADDHENQEAKSLQAGGMNVIRLTGDARAEILKALEPVTKDWALVQDRNGRQGTATLAAFKAALASP